MGCLLGAFVAMRQHPDVGFFRVLLILLFIIVLSFVLAFIAAHVRATLLSRSLQRDPEAPREPSSFAVTQASTQAKHKVPDLEAPEDKSASVPVPEAHEDK